MPNRAIVQVSLPRDGALPEDIVTNTMHFEGDTANDFATDMVGLANRVRTFYQAIGGVLSENHTGEVRVKVYDWEDVKPRVPLYETSHTFVPGSNSFPGEVALCLSYRAQLQSGGKPERRRGRIFLGPLSSNAGTDFDGEVRPSSGTREQIITAALTMATGSGGAFRLAVFSPTTLTAGGTVDEAWNDVTDLWVDNSFDTVRSRGSRPTSRSVGVI